ncbi:ketosteroid isomerase-like protein [Halopolyspora algeriensis]|uniref:Ketosteroid isomerase-like protein n=1 Tax=Halopolyspora algeriensis TaxID=1500506 RepID=A0A368W3J7_9ACTN|nr:nuclear transport factor 2 family protein [Halopolyspora algeriensis]RCW47253.1 ketosteroid isomerase-like protein [Halopolyspora algeriensis]TQM42489.1 ketosteroid isomerase-like protein [Halopolyspora algeriensis]
MTPVTHEHVSDTVERYLQRLDAGDVPGVLALFATDGVVSSPMQGDIPAREFYPELAATLQRATITAQELFVSTDDPRRAAVRFRYDWTAGAETPPSFDCIDVITINDEGLIAELRFVYDTHPLRVAWQSALDRLR